MKNGRIIVLHLITRLIKGGADENTLYTIKGLASKNGKYAFFLAAGTESDMSIVKKRLDGRIPFLLQRSLRRNISPFHDFLAFFSLVRLYRQTQCDILHTHTAKAGILGRIAGKMAGVPIIIHTLHGSSFHPNVSQPTRFIYRQIERLSACFTNKIISVSSLLSENYISAGIGRADQYTTVYSGMDLSKFANAGTARSTLLGSLGILEDEKIVGTICMLEPRKGVSFFLDMARCVKKVIPSCKFLIVGEGYQRQELESLRDAMGLTKDVIFTGYREDIPELLSIFDIFVLTSLWEGLPRVLVQAAAVGKPLVAFNVDGVAEIVKENENGYLIQPKNTDQLAEKVIYLLANPERAKAIGNKGPAIVKNKWSIETMVSQTERVYQDLLASNIGYDQKHDHHESCDLATRS